MSKKARPLAIKLVNEMQIVLGAMEVGDYDASLKSIGRSKRIVELLEEQILIVIEQKRLDELRNKKTT